MACLQQRYQLLQQQKLFRIYFLLPATLRTHPGLITNPDLLALSAEHFSSPGAFRFLLPDAMNCVQVVHYRLLDIDVSIGISILFQMGIKKPAEAG